MQFGKFYIEVLLIAFFCIVPNVTFAGSTMSVIVTFYGPGADVKMQGTGYPSRVDAEGRRDQYGRTILHTLDDILHGRSRYVTVASNPYYYGRWFCIGKVSFPSPTDKQIHTLENVIGYVHDTGGAFKHSPNKMDIAVGRFFGWADAQVAPFIIRARPSAPNVWTAISGLPQEGQVADQNNPCGGRAVEIGTPFPAPYIPTNIADPSIMSGMTNFGSSIPAPYNGAGTSYGTGYSQYPTQQSIQDMIATSTPVSELIKSLNGNASSTVTKYKDDSLFTPVISVYAQGKTVSNGSNILVSWSSVGLANSSCILSASGLSDTNVSANGSKIFTASVSGDGNMRFQVSCTRDGKQYVTQDYVNVSARY